VPATDSRILFTALVGLVACERLVELALSRRNARRAFSRGGVERGATHYAVMVLVHAAFLVASLLEVWWLDAPFLPALAAPMLLLVALAMALRYWVVATLGDRWNTRVICVPGELPVDCGPYRRIRHPNYLAVIVEVAALPLVHGAWRTALLFSAIDAVILGVRIAVEERALAECSEYARVFSGRARLLPGIPSPWFPGRPRGRSEPG